MKSAKDNDGNAEESKKALMCKSLTDKGWAEKQAAGFTNWLNFTLGGAEKPREGAGSDNGDQDIGEDLGDVGVGEGAADGAGGGSPLKTMMAMVRAIDDKQQTFLNRLVQSPKEN